MRVTFVGLAEFSGTTHQEDIHDARCARAGDVAGLSGGAM